MVENLRSSFRRILNLVAVCRSLMKECPWRTKVVSAGVHGPIPPDDPCWLKWRFEHWKFSQIEIWNFKTRLKSRNLKEKSLERESELDDSSTIFFRIINLNSGYWLFRQNKRMRVFEWERKWIYLCNDFCNNFSLLQQFSCHRLTGRSISGCPISGFPSRIF